LKKKKKKKRRLRAASDVVLSASLRPEGRAGKSEEGWKAETRSRGARFKVDAMTTLCGDAGMRK
jgi:hypothetical protein